MWKDMWSKLVYEILKPSTIIAFAFYGVYLYLVVEGKEVPANLNTAVSTLFGFWFGNKVANSRGGESKG